MMDSANGHSQMSGPQQALDAYLDALLDEAPQPHAAPVNTPAAPASSAQQRADAAGSRGAAPTDVAAVEAAAGGPGPAPGEFRVQSFQVAGLTLAVNGGNVTATVPAPWQLEPPAHTGTPLAGVLVHGDDRVPVLDVARLVLQPTHAAALDADIAARCTSLILIESSRLALAIDTLGEAFDLPEADVKWRGSGGQRLWLAGTIAARRCALLDTAELRRIAETAAD